MHRPFRHLADDLADVIEVQAARGQASRTVYIRLRHGTAGIWLERQRIRHPFGPEIPNQGIVVAVRGMREAVEEPMHTLEHGARSHNPVRASSAARSPDCAA